MFSKVYPKFPGSIQDIAGILFGKFMKNMSERF